MKRWMTKKAGTVVLAAATGLGSLSPAPLWSQNPNPAAADVQRRLAELYAREGKKAPKELRVHSPQPQAPASVAPVPVPPVPTPTAPVVPPSMPRWGSVSPEAVPIRQTDHQTSQPRPAGFANPAEVDITPRQTVNGMPVPSGIQAPVSGNHPKVTNSPVITPRQAAPNFEEIDPAPPRVAVRPIPVPQSKTAAHPAPSTVEDTFPAPTPWSEPATVTNTDPQPAPLPQQANPFEMPEGINPSAGPKTDPVANMPTKTEPNQPQIYPFEEPLPQPLEELPAPPMANADPGVKFTPHIRASHPIIKKPTSEKSAKSNDNPFEMPIAKDQEFAPPRPAITQAPTKTEQAKPMGNPFEMPIAKDEEFAPPRPAITQAPAKTEQAKPMGNPFEMPSAKDQEFASPRPAITQAPTKTEQAKPMGNPFEMPVVKEKTNGQPSAPVAKSEFDLPHTAQTPSQPQPTVKTPPKSKEAASTDVTGNPFAILGSTSQPKTSVKTDPKPEGKVAEKTAAKPEAEVVSKSNSEPVPTPIAATPPKVSSASVEKPDFPKVAATEAEPLPQKPATSVKPAPSPPQTERTETNTFQANSVSSARRLPEVALDGCCPVTLREQHKQVPGRAELICIWKRASYHFASPEAQRKFEQNPSYYASVSLDAKPSHSASTSAEPTRTIAMEGCCPVTLREERKLVPGQPELVCTWERTSYRFASPEAKQKFEQNPREYAPAESGLDITLLTDANQEVPGSLKHAIWYKKELYLFHSEATQNNFTSDPGKYLKQK